MFKVKELSKLNKSEKKEFDVIYNWFSLPKKTNGWGLVYSMNIFESSYLMTLVEKDNVNRIGELIALNFSPEKNKYYGADKSDICYELHLVGIEEAYRGKGFGKVLLSKALNFLKESALSTKVFIQVNNGNIAAINLYSKYFKEVNSGPGLKMITRKNKETLDEIIRSIKNEDPFAFSFVTNAVELGWKNPESVKSHLEILMVCSL